jgi:hypothetical protein
MHKIGERQTAVNPFFFASKKMFRPAAAQGLPSLPFGNFKPVCCSIFGALSGFLPHPFS